ncbi:hypothetical protein P7C73_g4543, partial [Tremellales sp. Uapishka_1]
MASARHRDKSAQTAESGMPLHMALAWLAIKIFPLNKQREPLMVYSATFTAEILQIIAREVLELSDTPSSFASLRSEVDQVALKCMRQVLKKNLRLRNSGQLIPKGHDVEGYDSWLGEFVSLCRTREAPDIESLWASRPTLPMSRMDVLLWMTDDFSYKVSTEKGDYSNALDSLRRFYDYQFPASGRGQHQHALLHLASFHYSSGGLESDRSAINEAIRVARAEGDQACLLQCMSLANRLRMETSASAFTPSETPRIRQYPISTGRLAEARSKTLAKVHEDLATRGATTGEDGSLTVLLSRAERMADQAEYEDALSMLLEMKGLDGMTIEEYRRWCRSVWTILEREATLCCDIETLTLLSHLRPPRVPRLGPGGPEREMAHPSPIPHEPPSRGITLAQDEVRSALLKARKMQASGHPTHLILPHVLSSLQLSSELGLWSLYRLSVVVFADVLLGMKGMQTAERAAEEVGNIWDQILASQDTECIALGALVLGKAELERSPEGGNLAIARDHLRLSLDLATKLGSRALILQTTTLLALISPEGAERDGWVARWEAAQSSGPTHVDRAKKIAGIITLVGVRVAEGWS